MTKTTLDDTKEPATLWSADWLPAVGKLIENFEEKKILLLVYTVAKLSPYYHNSMQE